MFRRQTGQTISHIEIVTYASMYGIDWVFWVISRKILEWASFIVSVRLWLGPRTNLFGLEAVPLLENCSCELVGNQKRVWGKCGSFATSYHSHGMFVVSLLRKLHLSKSWYLGSEVLGAILICSWIAIAIWIEASYQCSVRCAAKQLVFYSWPDLASLR